MKLSIVVCATKSYTYAMRAQARRVSAALALVEGIDKKPSVFIVGDTSKELAQVAEYWKAELSGCEVELIANAKFVEGQSPNYKQAAQLLIADMRTLAHAAARRVNSDWCWSLDSDTLPQANALRAMLDMCRFDGGYYSVAMCPYHNGAFLGGFGSPRSQISEDFLPHERKLPWKLKRAWESTEQRLKEASGGQQVPDKELARRDRLMKKIKQCPSDGNVFQVNGKHGYRRRGWFENAYPGIGLGCAVPTDWVGFGCTLMNKQALSLAYFEGYEGSGTEDLYIGWNRWAPNGLRMVALPHAPADHVIWEKKKGGDEKVYTLYHAYHEVMGECYGHLRVRATPWRAENR